MLSISTWLGNELSIPEIDEILVRDVEPTEKRQRFSDSFIDSVAEMANENESLSNYIFKNNVLTFEDNQEIRPNSPIEEEIENYIAFDCAEQNSDPMDWWKKHGEKLPKLSKCARRYLSAPATSADSERLFNVGRDIFDYRRTSLTATNAEMLIFLNQAIPKIGSY